MRKAIDELVAENILIRQQGRGTFVASHNRDRLLFYYFHIVSESGPKAYPEVGVRVVHARQGRQARLPSACGIAVGDPVFRIRNRLSLDERPDHGRRHHRGGRALPGLTEAAFRDRPSTIYNLYQEAFGVSVVRTSERLRATVADAEARRACWRSTRALRCCRSAASRSPTTTIPSSIGVSLVNTAQHEYWAEIGAN